MTKLIATFVIILSISMQCNASEKLKTNAASKVTKQLMTGVMKTVNCILGNKVLFSIPLLAVVVGYSLKEKEVPYDSDPFNMRNEMRPSRH